MNEYQAERLISILQIIAAAIFLLSITMCTMGVK